jgi:6-phosphogluconolactonase
VNSLHYRTLSRTVITMRDRFLLATASALSLVALAACAEPSQSPTAPRLERAAGSQAVGGVFATTNNAADNAVVAYGRAADGSLAYLNTYSTGGRGIGGVADPLQSQFALTLSRDKHLLFVVNAGSSDVSTFRVEKGGLTLLGTVPSGGVRPTSVTASNHTLYVMNAGVPGRVAGNVAGFRIGQDGSLTTVAGASRPLSQPAGAAAIRISPDGHLLAVTERTANMIDTYLVAPDGSLSGPAASPVAAGSAGPFGFDFTPRGQLFVSEAGSATASLYEQQGAGLRASATASTGGQRAPCWAIVTNDGRFGYTANAGSASISGFAIRPDGMALLADGAVTNLIPGAQPLDLDLSRDSKFLYVLENGTGTIGVLRVNEDGSLALIGHVQEGVAPRSGYMGVAAY